MPVRQTSKDAYKKLNIGEQQKAVLEIIRSMGDGCISDVAYVLGWERSTVSARMNELKAMNMIVFTKKKKSQRTNIISEHWRIRNTDEFLF